MDTPAAPFPVEQTWKLSDIFESDELFGQQQRELRERLPIFERWRGRLGESAGVLADALEAIGDATKQLARLRCYASLKSDVDTRIAANQGMRQEVDLLATDLSGRVSYLRPEILSLDPSTLKTFIDGEPRLDDHAFFLNDLMRQRAHVLGPNEERIMAESSLVTHSAGTLYQVLHNVDLPRPEITLSGSRKIRLTPVEFHKHRSSASREDRLRLFPAYYGAYAGFQDTLGHNLYSAVKSHMFRARVRSYDTCVAAALGSDNIPVTVYRNLIQQIRRGLPVIHRYYKQRARILGIERLEYPDLYCPLSSRRPAPYAPADAQVLIRDAVAPIGPEYVGALEQAFERRWIDWHPTEGKRPGAYATGWAYDVHPYVLVNYTEDYDSVSTLAHEMGHAMHSFFSNRTQAFARADYSIFVAEVASTLNEALLSRRMLEEARDDDERLFLLGAYLDGIRGTLFRQTMFAEFELEIHDRAERGEVLTSERLNEIYLGLLREYQGHDEGVMFVADDYAVEWSAIPHFYFDFYVYQYATGIIAATALAEALQGDDPEASARYVEFLSAGGSDYPLELLRRAGVDLETAEPYTAALGAVGRHLDQLEGLTRSMTSPTTGSG